MGICKDRISSPLEAGPSLVDTQKLPPQVSQALDYVSDRLMRKRLHLTLVVVRDDGLQAPRHPQLSSPISSPSPTPSSFAKLHFPSLPSSPRSISSSTSSFSSSSSSPSLTSPISPFTPFSPSFPTLGCRNTASQSPSLHGLRLYHASEVSAKVSRHLEDSFTRASKKFSSSDWLSAPLPSDTLLPTSPTASTLTNDLIRRSLQQNEVVFGGEGLTLLALDHVYTFKRALSAYSRTLVARLSTSTSASLSREEKLIQRNQTRTQAVDELRLLVLSQKGRQISQSYLLRAYDHLSVSIPALRSVNEAYKSCFHSEGVEMEAAKPMLPNPQLLRSISGRMIEARPLQDDGADIAVSSVYMGPYHRAPATPTRNEEMTPITRSEWNSLMWGRSISKTVEIC